MDKAVHSDLAVEVRGLTKAFKSVEAVKGIDLEVRTGETFGFLGPNGAGKSTTIKILCTLLLPTAGQAYVAGYDVTKDVFPIRQRISMVSGGETTGYGLLTTRENIWMFSQFYGVPSKVANDRIDELMDVFGLQDRRDAKVRTLSTGQRQKMNMIRGFVTNPDILFLDEPTVGLDIQTRRQVWSEVRALAVAGADDGLREIVVAGPSQTIFGRRAREILEAVDWVNGGGPGPLRGLSRLGGLGNGFTPSGDDFISGVLLAREMTGRGGPELDEQEIRSALDRTNDGGRTLLTGVLSRCFPAYLLEFAGAIAASIRSSSSGGAAVERSVQDAVRAAAAHGETSGTDAVTGFAWYLGLLGRRQQPPA